MTPSPPLRPMTSCPPRRRHLAALVWLAAETRSRDPESPGVRPVSRRSRLTITETGAILEVAILPQTMVWVITPLCPQCPGITDTTWTRASSRPPSPAPTLTQWTFTDKSLISSEARILKVSQVAASNLMDCVNLRSENDRNNEAQLSFYRSVN